jgi:hypothetical protein
MEVCILFYLILKAKGEYLTPTPKIGISGKWKKMCTLFFFLFILIYWEKNLGLILFYWIRACHPWLERFQSIWNDIKQKKMSAIPRFDANRKKCTSDKFESNRVHMTESLYASWHSLIFNQIRRGLLWRTSYIDSPAKLCSCVLELFSNFMNSTRTVQHFL